MTPTARMRYSTGTWLGLVRGRCLVALPADASPGTAAEVWDLLAGEPGVEEVLAAVLAGRLDLTGLPSFAIVALGAPGVHAFLRGDVELRLTGADGAETRLSGTGVSTWAERTVPDVRSLELLVAGAGTDAEDLPLESGAVRMSALAAELGPRPEDAGVVVPHEVPAAASAPVPPAAPVAEEPAATPDTPATHSSPGLIDSVPWLAAARPGSPEDDAGRTLETPADLGLTVAPPAQPDEATPRDEAAHPDDDADTVLSPPAPPAPPAAPATVPASVPPAADPDHDGQTILTAQLGRAAVGTPAPAAAPPVTTGPLVLARQCTDGHANPPTSTACMACGQSVGGEARQVRRPSLGRMRMSTGEVLELDRPAVIGRQPQAHRVAPGTMPRMVQVRSPHGDISRSHCEVVLEGWHVQLRDLKATNGTVLIREGQSPRRLGQGESVMVLDGDIADLGDGVSVRFEAIP